MNVKIIFSMYDFHESAQHNVDYTSKIQSMAHHTYFYCETENEGEFYGFTTSYLYLIISIVVPRAERLISILEFA